VPKSGHLTITLLLVAGMLVGGFLFVDLARLTAVVPLVTSEEEWSATGGFFTTGHHRIPAAAVQKIASPKPLPVWVSWSSQPDTRGRLRSPAFMPGETVQLLLGGYPEHSQNQVILETIDGRGQMAIATPPLHGGWIVASVKIPPQWQTTAVRLVAVDGAAGPEGWLGVGTPFALSSLAAWQQRLMVSLMPVAILMVLTLSSLIFFGLGMTLWEWACRQVAAPPYLYVLFCYAAVAAAGYAVFWITFTSRPAGIAVAAALMLTVVAGFMVPLWRRRLIRRLSHPDAGVPMMLVIGIAYCYLLLAYGTRPEGFDWQWAHHIHRRFGIAGDNLIPRELAFRLFEGIDLKNNFFDAWLSSDRPPLQAGMVLIQCPLWGALGRTAAVPHLLDLYYQVLGTLLQCGWVAAAWALMRALHLPCRKILLIIATLAPGGFFYFNSIFTWPKMLSGAMTIGVFLLLVWPRIQGARVSMQRMAVAAAMAVLSFLIHGGTAFALVGYALILLWPRFFPGWRHVALGLAVFMGLYAPWVGYQKVYDPPGNRLLKWHLGGVVDIDDRGAVETLVDVYGQMGFSGWAARKWELARLAAGGAVSYRWDRDSRLDVWRRVQFSSVPPALDVLNLGWLFVLGAVISRCRPLGRERRGPVILLAVGVFCSAVWLLLLNSEGVIPHGAYATMMMLFVGLAAALLSAPRWVYLPAFFLHALHGFFLWGFGPGYTCLVWWITRYGPYHRDPWLLVLAILVYLGMVFLLLKATRPRVSTVRV